jgi:hypothetical protein
MKSVLLLLTCLVAAIVRIARPGGARAIVAENLLLKQQLLLVARTRQRAPNPRLSERLLFGVLSVFFSPRRVARAGIVVRPSTLLRLHRTLVRRKYRELFIPRTRGKPRRPCG